MEGQVLLQGSGSCIALGSFPVPMRHTSKTLSVLKYRTFLSSFRFFEFICDSERNTMGHNRLRKDQPQTSHSSIQSTVLVRGVCTKQWPLQLLQLENRVHKQGNTFPNGNGRGLQDLEKREKENAQHGHIIVMRTRKIQELQ